MLRSIPYIRPVRGWITRGFGDTAPNGGGPHLGVDFAAAEGTPIHATAPGEVVEIYNDEYLGKTLVVKHSLGFTTRFGHCAQVLVAKGDHVERGQAIALVGNTGRSTAPHLHYEVIKNGKTVNPLRYMVD
jgi:murein DD-endopeptidase MepM/ murein hydrolase activator NlpD